MTPPVIHWFRRDLRLNDNFALHAAAQTAGLHLLSSDYREQARLAVPLGIHAESIGVDNYSNDGDLPAHRHYNHS